MTVAKSFEDLWIWQQSRELANLVYADFSPGTSAGNDYGFLNQIRRAAISVMNNTAEGFERDSNAEFAHFLSIAKGSCGEVRSMYYLAQDQKYVASQLAEERRRRLRQVSAGIASLRTHLLD